jgi:hypothetical protein
MSCGRSSPDAGVLTGDGGDRHEGRGDARGESFRRPDVTRCVRTFRLGVTETERTEYHVVAENRHDQRRRGSQAAMQIDDAGGPRIVRIRMNLFSQCGAPAADDMGHGARAVVGPDAVYRDQFANGAAASSRRMRSSDTPDRPAAHQMHETEVPERRNSLAKGTLDDVPCGVDGRRSQSCRDRTDSVHVARA